MGKKSGSRSTGSGGSKGGSSLSRGGYKGGNSVSKVTNKVTKSSQPGKQTTYTTMSHRAKAVMQKGVNSVKTTVTSTVTKAVTRPTKPSATPATTTTQTTKSLAVTVTNSAPKPSTSVTK